MGRHRKINSDSKKAKISIAKKLGCDEKKLFEIIKKVSAESNKGKDIVDLVNDLICDHYLNFAELRYFACIGVLEFLSKYKGKEQTQLWPI